jgi:hypothetical protein
MDAFFELRLNEEFEELREDLEIVKQNEFGRKIFEAYATEFNKSHTDEDSVQAKLAVAIAKLEDAEQTIGTLEESQATLVREAKLEKMLAPLTGKKKEQMLFVLQSVKTARLEEAYAQFIDRILKEDASAPAAIAVEKPAQLTESVVLTGDAPTLVQPSPVSDKFAHLRKLAGMTN